jgi:hypothetical protein
VFTPVSGANPFPDTGVAVSEKVCLKFRPLKGANKTTAIRRSTPRGRRRETAGEPPRGSQAYSARQLLVRAKRKSADRGPAARGRRRTTTAPPAARGRKRPRSTSRRRTGGGCCSGGRRSPPDRLGSPPPRTAPLEGALLASAGGWPARSSSVEPAPPPAELASSPNGSLTANGDHRRRREAPTAAATSPARLSPRPVGGAAASAASARRHATRRGPGPPPPKVGRARTPRRRRRPGAEPPPGPRPGELPGRCGRVLRGSRPSCLVRDGGRGTRPPETRSSDPLPGRRAGSTLGTGLGSPPPKPKPPSRRLLSPRESGAAAAAAAGGNPPLLGAGSLSPHDARCRGRPPGLEPGTAPRSRKFRPSATAFPVGNRNCDLVLLGCGSKSMSHNAEGLMATGPAWG